jgi:hypothetical protein
VVSKEAVARWGENAVEQLKLLMDYTIFHMGVYISLGGLMIALLGIKAFEDRAARMLGYVVFALGCFMIAGMCGGIIAANIPYNEKFNDFINSSIGIWGITFPTWLYIRVEHTAFWLGIFVFLFGFWRSHTSKADATAH